MGSPEARTYGGQDRFGDGIGIGRHLVVAEAEDVLAEVFEEARVRLVTIDGSGMLHRNCNYGDLGTTKLSFSGFQIEQQASIVGDYFKLTHGLKPSDGSGSIEDYRKIIPFLPGRRG